MQHWNLSLYELHSSPCDVFDVFVKPAVSECESYFPVCCPFVSTLPFHHPGYCPTTVTPANPNSTDSKSYITLYSAFSASQCVVPRHTLPLRLQRVPEYSLPLVLLHSVPPLQGLFKFLSPSTSSSMNSITHRNPPLLSVNDLDQHSPTEI